MIIAFSHMTAFLETITIPTGNFLFFEGIERVLRLHSMKYSMLKSSKVKVLAGKTFILAFIDDHSKAQRHYTVYECLYYIIL